MNTNDNIEQLLREIIEARANEGLAKALPEIAELILTSIADRFDEQSAGNPVFPKNTPGGAWVTLATSTLKRKKGGKILMGGKNAELRKLFNYRTEGLNLYITNNRTVGEYSLFEIHQYGAEAGRGGGSVIPARPMLALQREEVEEIADIIASSIK